MITLLVVATVAGVLGLGALLHWQEKHYAAHNEVLERTRIDLAERLTHVLEQQAKPGEMVPWVALMDLCGGSQRGRHQFLLDDIASLRQRLHEAERCKHPYDQRTSVTSGGQLVGWTCTCGEGVPNEAWING